jgi:hypothetical protein
MLQLMDLANENAALKRELERVRHEADALKRLLLGADSSAQGTFLDGERRSGETPSGRGP